MACAGPRQRPRAARTGQHEAGLGAQDKATRLSPNKSQRFIWESNRAAAQNMLGLYDATTETARRGASMRWYAAPRRS